MGKKLIQLENITKTYDGNMILDDLNLYVKENEFLTLLGPSGCGKTTTLRLIGGFETPDTGRIIFDGKDITSLPPNERKLNTMLSSSSWLSCSGTDKFLYTIVLCLFPLSFFCGAFQESQIPLFRPTC